MGRWIEAREPRLALRLHKGEDEPTDRRRWTGGECGRKWDSLAASGENVEGSGGDGEAPRSSSGGHRGRNREGHGSSEQWIRKKNLLVDIFVH